MPFERAVSVRFHEVDGAGIAFFGRVFEYCHVVFEDLLQQIVGDFGTVLRRDRWGMPLVHAEADYRHPMRMGDRLVIRLEVERLGRRSVTVRYDIRGDDGLARATVRLVHAFVDLDGFTTREVPAEFRAGLERLGLWAGR